MTFLGYRFGHEANMIFMRAPNNVLFYGTTALFDETLFPKCPTTKIPPVTQIRNKKKKSGETQPTVVIEYGSDSSDDYDDPPYPSQPENAQPRPKLGPGQPPLPPTGQRRLPPPYVPPPPPPALPPRPPSWRQGPPSSVAGPSGTQDEATPADGPRRSHRERRFPFREGNVYSPGTQSDKDRHKKFGKQNIAPESISELPAAVSSDTDAISMETVNSTTEGESHWINNLLTKAIPYDDSLPDPANIRDWTARDLDRLPADQQKEWREAQFEELEALKKRNVYELTELPPGRKAIKNRWVFDIKSDGRKKARLVAKGFSQIEGLDYEQIFSPVVRFETIRTILALAALEKWTVKALDVKSAFLYGPLDEEIYMEQPQGFKIKGKEHLVL